MKTDDEMYQSLLSRYEVYQEKKMRRFRIVSRAVPVFASFCFAAVIGIGWWGHISRTPNIIDTPDIADPTVTAATSATTAAPYTVSTAVSTHTSAVPVTSSAAVTVRTGVTASAIIPQSTAPQVTAGQAQLYIPPVTQPPVTVRTGTQPVTHTVTQTVTAVQTTAADTQAETVVTAQVTTETPGGDDMAVHHSTALTTDSGASQKPIEGPSVRNWEDLPLPDKYPQARINGSCVYSVTWSTVSEDMIDSFLGDAYMVGVYDGMEYHCSAKAYLVQGFSDSMAVAIRFDDDDKYNLYKFIYEE